MTSDSETTPVPRPMLMGLGSALAIGMAACAPSHTDAGRYRIATVSDNVPIFGCQPRTELYYLGASDGHPPQYLGTCGTPKFVTGQLGLPSDPSCFAVAADGDAIVYFHRPQWCGAGERAAAKPGGLYRHSAELGDRLVYTEAQVGQVWSAQPIESNAVRVRWHSATPSPGGAGCAQNLIVLAEGGERPEGKPETVHGCKNP